VSSTNLFHLDGFKGKESKAFFSKFFMKRLTTMGDNGDPIARRLVCS
jgi:hypothetical protein